MLETLRVQPHIRARIRSGPLGPYVDGFVAALERERYTAGVIRRYVRTTEVFGRWLRRGRIAVRDIDEAIVAQFVGRLRRTRSRSRPRGLPSPLASGVRKLAAFLWAEGTAVRRPSTSADPAWAPWLRSFDEYLTRVTGVAAGTRRIYLRYARAFLTTHFGTGAPTWAAVTAEAIADFVRIHAATLTPSECRAPVTATRAFLRFLSTTGVIRPGLDGAVPTVRQWTLATVPRALTADELERVFAACDDARATRPRDRAVLLLLGRLGLRASEVAALQQEDIDWREGQVRIRAGKRYDAILADLHQHYAATGTRDLKEFKRRVAHLDRVFAGRRVATIGQPDVDGYVVARQAKGAKPATIRRELGTLTTMLRLAYENGKLLRLPILHKPKEGAPREGFFEAQQYEAVRRHLPEDLRVAVQIAYTFGWRTQSEILTLERRHVDLEAGTLRLDPGTTKNRNARIVYLTPEVKTALAGQLERVKALERRLGRIVPSVFPHRGKGRRAGEPRRDFRKAWATACRKAGLPGRLRHDFRRTAVRNMERRGVSRSVATKITGHRTESVYRRYAIVSDADLREAARKLTGTITGTVAPGTVDSSP